MSENNTYATPLIHLKGSDNIDIGLNLNLKHIYNKVPDVMFGRIDLSSSNIDINNNNFNDISIYTDNGIKTSCSVKAQYQNIQRIKQRDPQSVESYIYHSLQHPEINTYDSLEWSIDSVLVPNITDPETILQLAKLASNAYARLPADPSWRDVNDPDSNYGKGFNNTDGFGWSETGIRGHVFVENIEDEQHINRPPLIIIAIKGTTAAGLGGGNGGNDGEGGKTGDDGKTVEMDKLNDNLLFSCCCARVSSLWSTVCDCYEKAYTCNQNCLENSLRNPDRYYKAVLDIYRDVRRYYPDSEVWVTGHSLGGALSSLLGRTYGLPVVTFEAPGEMLATKRLHLPIPPGLPISMEHVWHFGNNADPIFMGVCNGASSTCGMAGYAMETVCHSGMTCTYDTIKDKGWHVNILNHRLKTVIDELLMKSNETAQCIKPPPCIDCYDWTFVDHNANNRKRRTTITKSSSTSSTKSLHSTTTTSTKERKCLKRTWYGTCYKWSDDDDDDDDGNKGELKRDINIKFPKQTGL
ncbi:putative lipase atg15 [Pichia californica]|nr:putative lipase atg15 [[Candida] californica]